MASVATSANLPVARDIPTTFATSFAQWWCSNADQSRMAEERLFRRLPFFRSSGDTTPVTGGVIARLRTLDLSGKGRYLNMLTISPVDSDSKEITQFSNVPPVVFLPGYGSSIGIGFFYRNFEAMGQWAAKRKTDVYALDWLGMGRSARVPFKINAKREDTKARVEEAESFFLDALEEWRVKMGIEKMSLVGHSLGAYLSTAYALKHPERVNQLILLSPAGVPRDPNTTEQPAGEIDLTPGNNGAASGGAVPATEDRVKEVRAEQRRAQREASTGWKGWSPFQVVRSAAFYGPWLVGKYSNRRFDLTEEEKRDVHDYIWHITRARGSGEYCIGRPWVCYWCSATDSCLTGHLLAPGAHARMPLVDRINALRMPITFAYGDRDWMDPAGGKASIERLKAAGNGISKMFMVPDSGHHATVETVTKEAAQEVNQLADQDVDTVDTNARYFAYGARLRTALRASTRYIILEKHFDRKWELLKRTTSGSHVLNDCSVVPPAVVTAAYGVSWAYLAGDVGYETYKAKRQGPSAVEAANFSEPTRLSILATQRAVFQSVASMGFHLQGIAGDHYSYRSQVRDPFWGIGLQY
ncbi:abhydrolase domain-containing protein [Rhizoctonia solani AG-1 IA]|uniref:Abhydrolase domain-containing protein n=1 Tax=Thanatephorus cucumeris (strain AG1-IA) TaxID=983506 RepID=L8X9Y5_THACA|nr:abhydrolase domain-containing protein [Rhizoctonia solani AG-1 IA]